MDLVYRAVFFLDLINFCSRRLFNSMRGISSSSNSCDSSSAELPGSSLSPAFYFPPWNMSSFSSSDASPFKLLLSLARAICCTTYVFHPVTHSCFLLQARSSSSLNHESFFQYIGSQFGKEKPLLSFNNSELKYLKRRYSCLLNLLTSKFSVCQKKLTKLTISFPSRKPFLSILFYFKMYINKCVLPMLAHNHTDTIRFISIYRVQR